MYRKDPARVVNVSAVAIAVAVVFICLAALAPNFALVAASFAIAYALLAVLTPSLAIALLSVIPSGMRPHAAALLGIATAVGGLAGAVILGSVDSQYGIVGTIISLIVPGIIGALILRS